MVMYHMGLADCLMLMPEYYDSRESGAYSKDHIRGYSLLKASDVEKSVMFEEATITRSADIAKDKRSVYRNRKLSREDKLALYAERPDLDLRNQMQQKQQQPQQDEDEEEQKEPPPPQEPPRQPRVQCSVGFSGSLFSGGTEETTDELSRPLLLDGANEAAAVGGSPHLAGSRRVGVPIVDLESNGAEADGSCGSDIIPLTVNPMHGRRFESINISHTNKEVLSPDSSFNMDNDAAAADSPAHIWISNELSFAARNQQAPAAIAPHATAAQETTRTWRDAQREDDSDASSDDENDEEDLELSRPIWSASTS